MEKIASFKVNHDTLKKGVYISRKDGDAITYDVRMKIPNAGDYLTTAEAHTIEHLFATFARNSAFAENVIYVGPMGCRTGFYLILREDVSYNDAIELIKSSFDYIACFDGEIPGNTAAECGNYKDHDLAGAKKIANDMQTVLAYWKTEDLAYPK